MSTRSNDDRCLLSSRCAPPQIGKVIRDDLQCIKQIVEILNLRHRPDAAHCHSNGLADNGCFANTGVGDSVHSILLLQMRPALIHPAQMSDVFAERDEIGKLPEGRIQVRAQDFESF